MQDNQSPQVLEEVLIVQKINDHLNEYGIPQSFISRKLGYHRSWFNKQVRDRAIISGELLKRFEEVLKTRFSEPQTENNGQEI